MQVNFAPCDWLWWSRAALDWYRQFRRAPVFAHDSLILGLARDLVQHRSRFRGFAEGAGDGRRSVLDLLDALVAELDHMRRARAGLVADAEVHGVAIVEAGEEGVSEGRGGKASAAGSSAGARSSSGFGEGEESLVYRIDTRNSRDTCVIKYECGSGRRERIKLLPATGGAAAAAAAAAAGGGASGGGNGSAALAPRGRLAAAAAVVSKARYGGGGGGGGSAIRGDQCGWCKQYCTLGAVVCGCGSAASLACSVDHMTQLCDCRGRRLTLHLRLSARGLDRLHAGLLAARGAADAWYGEFGQLKQAGCSAAEVPAWLADWGARLPAARLGALVQAGRRALVRQGDLDAARNAHQQHQQWARQAKGALARSGDLAAAAATDAGAESAVCIGRSSKRRRRRLQGEYDDSGGSGGGGGGLLVRELEPIGVGDLGTLLLQGLHLAARDDDLVRGLARALRAAAVARGAMEHLDPPIPDLLSGLLSEVQGGGGPCAA